MKRIALYSILILLFTGGNGWAYQHGVHLLGQVDHSEGGTLAEVGGLVKDLAVFYSVELERGAMAGDMGRYAGINQDDPYIDELREEHARDLARTALRAIIRGTIEQVDLLDTIRSYAQRMTTTRLDVRKDRLQVFGPTLNEDNRGTPIEGAQGPSLLSLRSGMSMTDTIHPVPMLQARIMNIQSKLTYDPLAGGDWRLMVGRALSASSAVEVVYLHRSTDVQDVLATLRVAF